MEEILTGLGGLVVAFFVLLFGLMVLSTLLMLFAELLMLFVELIFLPFTLTELLVVFAVSYGLKDASKTTKLLAIFLGSATIVAILTTAVAFHLSQNFYPSLAIGILIGASSGVINTLMNYFEVNNLSKRLRNHLDDKSNQS